LNTASGGVMLGYSVRQSDGSVKQYGRIPESGREISFKRYRYGGGVKGNLPVNSIRTLTSSVAYISRVTNLIRSFGGRDEESLDEVKLRAQRELQAQKRAVTVQDYEQLVLNFSRSIARVKCISPKLENMQNSLGMVEILTVPSVADALRVNDLSRLWMSKNFSQEIVNYLDQYRLLTSHVKIREPKYTGVKVKARIVAGDFSDPDSVAARVDQHLRNFLNPLMAFPENEESDQLLDASWNGWPFGKNLFTAEIFSLIQRVPGVKYVLDVEIQTREVSKEIDGNDQSVLEVPLENLEDKVLWISHDSLLCSLDHEISMADLSEVNQDRE
jgi:predicted phage baseplate assembly protein